MAYYNYPYPQNSGLQPISWVATQYTPSPYVTPTNYLENNIYGIINGYTIYKPGYGPVYGSDVPPIPKYMFSKFGWKIANRNGIIYWDAMDEMDYRNEIGKMLDMNPEEVDLSFVLCGSSGDTGCHGDCPENSFCLKIGGSDGTFCMCSAYLTEIRPRHWLTLINITNRKLYLQWGGSTHTGDSTESYLNPGDKDTKKSERTNDANFEVKIYRLKNGEWLETGLLTEHVSGDLSGHENYNLIVYRYPSDPEDIVRFGKEPTNMNAPETIEIFKKDEW